MPGSMTSGVPDYQDPDAEARGLLGSRKRSDREKGKELLQLMEQRQNRDTRDREFNERAFDRRASEQDRQSQAKNRQDQLDLYREQLNEARNNRGEDVRSAHLNKLLDDPNTKPEIRSAIENHLLKAAGVSATLPVDPKVAALARSRGLPEPQPTVLGGGEEKATANSEASASNPNGFNRDFHYPVLTNTPETSFTGRGHGSLEGSKEVAGGIQTPSGGFIGTNITPGVEKLIGRGESKPQFGATQPDAFRGHGAGSSFGETAGIGDIVSGKTTPEQQAAARPDITGIERPGFGALKSIGGFFAGEHPTPESVGAHPEIQPTARPGLETAKSVLSDPTGLAGSDGSALRETNQNLGHIGQSLEPFTAAKNAAGSLFGGGQGGAKDIVKQPTPAPGTEFQGPLTAAAGFAAAPLAPTPVPANTPPAIPPVNKPTPEEERRRMALQQ